MDEDNKQEQPRVDAVAVIQGVEAGLFGWKVKEQKPPEDEKEEGE